jgi:purine-binding chemotaxis protein CheW
MTTTQARLSIGGKFLTFFLAGEEYGIEILKVREIIGLMPITRVPNAPRTICGVINLRGKVIPVMELRLSFGLDTIEATEQTCIIVVQAGGIEFGIVVDRVSEVANVADEDIEDAPSFGEDSNTEYLLGIAKAGGRVKLLLDIDRVLSSSELRHAEAASVAAA